MTYYFGQKEKWDNFWIEDPPRKDYAWLTWSAMVLIVAFVAIRVFIDPLFLT